MFEKYRSHICFWVVLLVLVFTGINSIALVDQSEADKATAKLKVLSESLEANDIAQIRDLVKAGADVNAASKDGVTSLMIVSQGGPQ